MNQIKPSYLLRLQYLGFRYHGWAKYPGMKTVHSMVDKTLDFVLGQGNYKSHGASRTDAMVSAEEYLLAIFPRHSIEPASFLQSFNANLPADIRALSIEPAPEGFNIIQSVKEKEYIYLFANEASVHPFCASMMHNVTDPLDIDAMQAGAELLEGRHNFRRFCTKPSPAGNFERNISLSAVEPNTFYTANFFPEKSFVYRVRSAGFMRNQVRLMVAALFDLGKGDITLEQFGVYIAQHDGAPLRSIAPASGLILRSVQ